MKKCGTVLLLCALLCGIPPANPESCLPCTTGQRDSSTCKCKGCEPEQYRSLQNGRSMCNRCTKSCSEKKNLIEVTPCTNTSDRRCQCKSGHYCPNAVNLTCRRDCEPCTNGFTNAPNLNQTCQQYTDCASLGLVVIKEGSPIADRVCGKPAPNPVTAMPETPSIMSQSVLSSIFTSRNSHLKTSSVSTPGLQSNSQNPDTSLASETTATIPDTPYTMTPSPSSPIHKHETIQPDNATHPTSNPGSATPLASETTTSGMFFSISPTEGTVLPPERFSKKTTWISSILLLVFLCLVLYLFLKCKSRAIKSKLEWAGLPSRSYQSVFPTASHNSNLQTPGPVSDATDTVRAQAQGQGSFPGKNQQVTMEHFGKADGVNNTVGSIFIYSPGMVILGSNSNEKKEEAETGGEDVSEDTCLMSVPQQESSSEEDFIRLATQEELGKELSIPIPATSK
ncbi:tumor necrosis factor receptor superfamily member 21 [Neoarius graeffei]|uniref:tumor necrosis factor receptor superfamily member 21 n=1 Tax=Neoarius graeffei TaxID=443677 RepID=UPI00298BEF48|nr:tumor necrosis factor receptor superfamily member 21 [Neoarius graeffei]